MLWQLEEYAQLKKKRETNKLYLVGKKGKNYTQWEKNGNKQT